MLPSAQHQHTIIILHGTSQTGPAFASEILPSRFVPPLEPGNSSQGKHEPIHQVTFPEYFPNCKFVFPSGATRKTTVFRGKETNAWFDITDFADRTKGEMEMIEGLRESSLYLSMLIREESELLNGSDDLEKHLNLQKVFLIGFSQGSAMGSMLLLGGELERLGALDGFDGFIGMSGWLPFRQQVDEHIVSRDSPESNHAAGRTSVVAFVRELLGLDHVGEKWTARPKTLDMPVLLCHGEDDPKVKLEWGQQLKETFGTLGMSVSFKSYAGLAHSWNEDELTEVASFLKTIMLSGGR